MPTDRIPLLYILSNGRSGTTLLDLLLGAHQHVWTTGEVQNLPWELINPRAPCGSGVPVPESAFWGPLLEKLPTEPTGYHIGYFRNYDQVGEILQWELLPDVIRGEVSDRWGPAITEYGDNNEQLFQHIHQAAEERTGDEIKWIVDASKDVYRLLWLQASGRFDIRVIHMMKDPRSLVYSMARPWLPWGANKVFRYTIRWIVENALMAQLCRNAFDPAHVYRLHYKSLAASPAYTMQSLGEWLQISYPEHLVHNFKKYENFALSGNMMQWRESDDEIRLDERWKRDFPALYRSMVAMLTRPFAELCGYKDGGVLEEGKSHEM